MKAWIIFFVLNGMPDAHALGYFQSQDACWRWVNLANRSGRIWVGRCMTLEDFSAEQPYVEIEDLET